MEKRELLLQQRDALLTKLKSLNEEPSKSFKGDSMNLSSSRDPSDVDRQEISIIKHEGLDFSETDAIAKLINLKEGTQEVMSESVFVNTDTLPYLLKL